MHCVSHCCSTYAHVHALLECELSLQSKARIALGAYALNDLPLYRFVRLALARSMHLFFPYIVYAIIT